MCIHSSDNHLFCTGENCVEDWIFANCLVDKNSGSSSRKDRSRRRGGEMPASFMSEFERPTGSLGEDRALQLAFELSMLGLSDSFNANTEPDTTNELSSFVNPLGSVGLEEVRSKKSQNMTECVPVPSSEHVAEIVGRQGKGFFFCYFCGFFSNTRYNRFFLKTRYNVLYIVAMRLSEQVQYDFLNVIMKFKIIFEIHIK